MCYPACPLSGRQSPLSKSTGSVPGRHRRSLVRGLVPKVRSILAKSRSMLRRGSISSPLSPVVEERAFNLTPGPRTLSEGDQHPPSPRSLRLSRGKSLQKGVAKFKSLLEKNKERGHKEWQHINCLFWIIKLFFSINSIFFYWLLFTYIEQKLSPVLVLRFAF